MNAIEMLKKEHRAVEKLFERFESARGSGPKRKAFEEIADALAVHAAIEEKHFYPAVKETSTEDLVGSSRVDLQACKLEYSIVSPK